MKKIALLFALICAPVLAFGQTNTANTFRPTATPPAPPCPYYRVFLNLSNQMAKVDCLGNVTVIEGGGGGGSIGGTGTSGTIAKFTGTTNIGNSLISEAGSVVTIGGTVLNIRGLSYTFPAAHAAGALTNNGSGTFSYQAFAIPGGPTGAVQYQNGANVFEGSSGYLFDVASNTVTIGQNSLSGSLRLKNTNGNIVSLVTSSPGASFTLTLPNVTDTIVTKTSTDVLTNKTLTAPTIADFSNANHNHSTGGLGGQLTVSAFPSTSLTGGGSRFVTASSVPSDGCAQWLSGNLTSTLAACGSGGGSSTTSQITVTQTAHGFTVLTPVFNNTDGSWGAARNDTSSKWATGLVVAVPDANTLTIAVGAGAYTVTAHGLDLTQIYFLADTGGLTTTVGGVNRQAILTPTGTSGNVIQYFGLLQNPGGGSGGGGGAVASVFGRSGAVVATSGDYSFSQISGTITNTMVNASAAIAQTKLAALTASKVAVTDASGFLTASAIASTDIQNATKLQSRDIANTAPTNGQALVWSTTNTRWEPGTVSGGGGGGVADPGTNGVMIRTALNTTTARTIAGGLGIGIVNGDGVAGNPTIAVTGPIAVTTLTTNGVLYGNGTGAMQATAASGTGTFCFISTNGGAPTWGSCAGSSSTTWNALSNATGNMSVNQGNFTSTLVSSSALTSTARDIWILSHDTSGAAAPGFGNSILFRAEESSNTLQDMGRLRFVWDNSVTSVRTARFDLTMTYASSTGIVEANPLAVRADKMELKPFDITAGSTFGVRWGSLATSGKYFSVRASDAMAADVNTVWPDSIPGGAPASNSAFALTVKSGGAMEFNEVQKKISWSSPLSYDTSTNTASCPTCAINSSGVQNNGTIVFTGVAGMANWSFAMCSDCQVTSGANNTCASGGTGAVVFKLATVARCFAAQN